MTTKHSMSSPYNVFSVEMNRPAKMNALNKEMWTDIDDVFTKMSQDPDCRVVVLSAAVKMFRAGVDLYGWMGSCLVKTTLLGRVCLFTRHFARHRVSSLPRDVRHCPWPL